MARDQGVRSDDNDPEHGFGDGGSVYHTGLGRSESFTCSDSLGFRY